jgi:hypothetical protein
MLLQIEIISALPKEAVITIYRVGPMVDLCTGPHLPSTSYLKVCVCVLVFMCECLWGCVCVRVWSCSTEENGENLYRQIKPLPTVIQEVLC